MANEVETPEVTVARIQVAEAGSRTRKAGIRSLQPTEPCAARLYDREFHKPGPDRDDLEIFLYELGRVLSHVLGGFETAGFIHRAAALVMFGTFIAHLQDLYRQKKEKHKRLVVAAFWSGIACSQWADFREFIATMKWFVGRGQRPQYGRWTYWEKFDYFAVFWGIFVIGSTGLTLWFPIFFTRFMPGSFINVATIIHSDEALLATGFIFTVHFFNTHLRPEKFPMDTTVFTGTDDARRVEARQTAENTKHWLPAANLQENLAEPHPPIVVKDDPGFRLDCACHLGFGIVVWIIYAMLFAYR